jgi:hypothetical protein
MAEIRNDGTVGLDTGAAASDKTHKGVMDSYNDSWWRDNYSELEGLQADRGYQHYEPALRYGWQSAAQHRGKQWTDVEPTLSSGWQGSSRDKAWDDVKHAVRHSWERAMKAFEG